MIKNRAYPYPACFSILDSDTGRYGQYKLSAANGITAPAVRKLPVMKIARNFKRFGITTALLLCLFTAGKTVSANDMPIAETPDTASAVTKKAMRNNEKDHSAMNEEITIRIGPSTFSATLSDNPTAQAFRKLLPLTITMQDHAGNEKFHTLANTLPTDASLPDKIRTGDLMLWGNDCIVLFYKTFSTSYQYTPIGKIGNPSGLAEALGHTDVTITFQSANQTSP